MKWCKKVLGFVLLFTLFTTLWVPAPKVDAWGGTFTNVITNEDTPDPSIAYRNGWYYMTFTHDDAGAVNIAIIKSRTLDFRNGTKKVVWTPPAGTSYDAHLWAPELQYLDGKWVIYFAASDGDMNKQRMYAIEADSQDPMGSWTFKGQVKDATNKWAIDGVVFERNGEKYYVWSGWEGDTNTRQVIYIARMSDRYTISSDRVMISYPQYDWEKIGDPDVNEGPQPLIRNGKIFIVYSASGSWTPDYKLGMLSIDYNADLLNAGNWYKYTSPVFQRNDSNSVYGPGHNTFVQSPDRKEDWIVYHATPGVNDGWNNRKARAQRFSWNSSGTPNFGTPQALTTPMDIPSSVGKFEAEHAWVNRASIVDSCMASNCKKVGFIDYSDSFVQWGDVRVPSAGTYRLQIRFGNGSGTTASHNVIVNGTNIGKINYRNTGWDNWDTTSINVSLKAGSNSIRLGKGDYWAELDYMDITRFEAEHAGINKAKIVDHCNASNCKKVGYMDYSDSWVEFRNIQVPAEGTYILRIRYANGSGAESSQWISVNGGTAFETRYTNTGWDNWASKEVNVSLKAGNNYIRFTKGLNYSELDYVEVYKN
jgi:GH43 family beta-xylosidase